MHLSRPIRCFAANFRTFMATKRERIVSERDECFKVIRFSNDDEKVKLFIEAITARNLQLDYLRKLTELHDNGTEGLMAQRDKCLEMIRSEYDTGKMQILIDLFNKRNKQLEDLKELVSEANNDDDDINDDDDDDDDD